MDGLSEQLDALVGRTYVQQGLQSIASRHKLFKALLSSRELPSTGTPETDRNHSEPTFAEYAKYRSCAAQGGTSSVSSCCLPS